MKHFLSLRDDPAEELDTLLHRAEALRRRWQEQRMPTSLSGKRIALWFYGNGLRNRLALYTDCWPRASTPEEKEAIKAAFLPYQIQLVHLAALGNQGVFLPCPPVTRGEEVSPEVMVSPLCRNHAAKDNLLHVQNAIMEWLIGNAGDAV